METSLVLVAASLGAGLLLAAHGAVRTAPSAQTAPSTSWLDRPMSAWYKAGAAIPPAAAGAESRTVLDRRCGSAGTKASPAAAGALAKAGWTPFLHLDRQIQRDDVEVLGGMSAASPQCEPATFNLFVFVGGAFAGTLSPTPMAAGRDGVIGAVRSTGSDTLTAEFARYKPADPECCPSAHVRTSYRIERARGGAVVSAIETRPIR